MPQPVPTLSASIIYKNESYLHHFQRCYIERDRNIKTKKTFIKSYQNQEYKNRDRKVVKKMWQTQTKDKRQEKETWGSSPQSSGCEASQLPLRYLISTQKKVSIRVFQFMRKLSTRTPELGACAHNQVFVFVHGNANHCQHRRPRNRCKDCGHVWWQQHFPAWPATQPASSRNVVAVQSASTGGNVVVARGAVAVQCASTGGGAVCARGAEEVNFASTGGDATGAGIVARMRRQPQG